MSAHSSGAAGSPPNTAGAAAAGPTPRLGVVGVRLNYGGRAALYGLSLEVAPGEVLGLLGPNGSGKSSLIRCLTGLASPDRGVLRLDGRAISMGAQQLRAQMGVVFQEPSLDARLPVLDNLLLGASLYGIRGARARSRAMELLTFMELDGRHDDVVGTLSGGMRRRLELARALIHGPRILLLDEPTQGLDPAAQVRTWQRLMALRAQQTLTILVSTHSAEEAAHCDRVVVLNAGRVVATDTPAGLLARVAGDVIVMEAHNPQGLVGEIQQALGLVAHVHEGQVLLEREAGHTWVPRLVEALPKGRLQALSLRRPTLADAFFRLTGGALTRPRGE